MMLSFNIGYIWNNLFLSDCLENSFYNSFLFYILLFYLTFNIFIFLFLGLWIYRSCNFIVFFFLNVVLSVEIPLLKIVDH